MKPRTLAILFAVVLALGSFVWFVERDLPGSDERAERAKRLFDVEEDAVTGLVWERDGGRVELRREVDAEDGWRLAAPLEGRADSLAVEGLVTKLLALEKERTIDDGDAAQLGLGPPRATLEIVAGEEARRMLIGGEVPATSNVIVAADPSGPFHVVAGGAWDDLEKPAGDWRSRDVFGGDREAIDRIVLDDAGRRVELARRNEEFWIEAPLEDRADPGTVNRFLDALTGLRIERFIDEPLPGDDPYGLSTAAGAVEIVSGGATWRLELGGAAGDATSPTGAEAGSDDSESDDSEAEDSEDGERFARAEGRVFVAADALGEAVARPAEEWRSLEWARRQVFEIDAVRLRDANGELTLERDAGEWMRDGATVDFNLVSDLLYAVTGTKAVALDATPTGDPILEITLDPGEGEQRLAVFAPQADRHPATAGDRDAALWLGGDQVRDLAAKLQAVRDAEAEPSEAELPPADDGSSGDDE